MNVLLLENDAKVGAMLVQLMKRWDMEAVLVPSCETAREVLFETSIDFLVADLVLEDSTSLELIVELRESERFRDLPILMVSGKAGKEEIVKASRAGVDSFLAKPFAAAQLRRKILEIHRLKRRQRQGGQAREMWENRTIRANDVSSAHVIFGEPISSLEELLDPHNRSIKSFLVPAWMAIQKNNEAQTSLNAGYSIEGKTSDILLYVRQEAVLRWVKVIFLSCHCRGHALVIARIIRMNRGKTLSVYLLYDQKGEIPDTQTKTLKKLGIKILKRDRAIEKLDELMALHLRGKSPRKAAAQMQRALAPSAVKDRVMADIETMTDLPQLPQVFEKISQLDRDPKSDLKEWIKVIEVEPMTCAMILRHANSSSMGMQTEITAVDRAVVMLGKNTVSGLVASEAVRKSFTAVEDIGFKLEEFWLHNLAVGYSAHLLSLSVATDSEQTQGETIATAGLDDEAMAVLRAINLPERLELPPDSPCFIAGTMHDIGKGVMVHSYPGLFPMLLEELQEKEWKVPMLTAERTVAGGLTHPVAGEVLMRSWGLADRLGNVVLSHHSPDPDDPLTFLVSVADVVGQVLFPFPAGAAYPLAKAVEEESLTHVMAFLPAGFLDQPLLSTDELVRLIKAIRSRVRQFVDETRHSVM